MLLQAPRPSPAGKPIHSSIGSLPDYQHFHFLSPLPMQWAGNTKPTQELKDIAEPHPHDVLCGRGASISNFVGNLRWRELVKEKKEEYVKLHKLQRHVLSESIVYAVRHLDPPGRFLQRDADTGLWYDIGDQKANEKTAQALREGAPKLRKQLASAAKAAEKKAAESRRGSSSSFASIPGSDSQAGFNSKAKPAAAMFVQPAQAASVQETPDSSMEFEPLPFDLVRRQRQVFSGRSDTQRAEANTPLPPDASFRRVSAGIPNQQQNATTTNWGMMENEFPINHQRQQQDERAVTFIHPSRKIDMGFATRNPLTIEQDHCLLEGGSDTLLSHAADILLHKGRTSSTEEEEEEEEVRAHGNSDAKPPSS